MVKRKEGFTLIELMIVVAIIAIIAAIAIPNLLRSKLSANESCVIGNLRTIASAEETFRSAGDGSYTNLLGLSQATPPYIDSVLATGTKCGYTYVVASATATWEIDAHPETVGTTGNRRFFCDVSGVIRQNTSGDAGSSDEPIK